MKNSKKQFKNFLVHLFLACLVLIWVAPIAWIILISFRAESGAYTSTFFPKSYTINN